MGAACRSRAAAVYLRSPGDAEHRLLAVEALRIDGGEIAEIVDFSDPAVLAAFDLPPVLP